MHYHYYHFRLQDSVYVWLIIAGGLYSLRYLWRYLLYPFVMRQNSRYPGLVSYRSCEVGELPEHVIPYFMQMVPVLAEQGFITVGCATRVNPENNQESYVSLWINAKQIDTAQIITVIVPHPKTVVTVTSFVAFRTQFTDDTSIVTANSPSQSVFPADPAVFVISVRAIADIAALYRLHRLRVVRHRGSRTPTLAAFTDAPTRLQNEHNELFTRTTKAGYHTYDAASDEYVPTLRGAFMMTYRLLTPFKQIQRWRKKRRANREMRLVGFEIPVTQRA